MKILITGGSGLVGRYLIELLEQKNIEYISTYNSRLSKNGFNLDFSNENTIDSFFKEQQPTICINCIVQRYTDICEKDWNMTYEININIVDRLTRVCKKYNIYFIHLSTDYVFDGKVPPFFPESLPNPLQNYGISKLISELRVKSNIDNYTIIRVPVLYTDSAENLSENAVTLIGKSVLNKVKNIKEDDLSIRRPVYIPDLCNFIIRFINSPEYGIFHFYNPYDKVTKYKISKIIAEYLNTSYNHITPVKDTSINFAARPYDTFLNDTKYNIEEYTITRLEEGISRCFSKWKHPSIYDINNKNEFFFLIDLDGTLVDTDKLHYECYKNACNQFNIELSYDEFNIVINTCNLETYFLQKLSKSEYIKLKEQKNKLFNQIKNVEFIKGADIFLKYCIENDINLAVVTNTSRETVEFLKGKLPLLNSIKNWIVREDYSETKPNSECYELAISKYYKNEKYIIGFENTLSGYESIKKCVNITYFITDENSYSYKQIKNEDIFLVKDFTQI
jgi:S-adenosylmethionine synthetase